MTSFFTDLRKKVSRKKWYTGAALLTLALAGGIGLYNLTTSFDARISSAVEEENAHLDCFPIEEPEVKFGFVVNNKQVVEGQVENGQTLADLLVPHGVDFLKIDRIARLAKDEEVFDVRRIRPGKDFMLLSENEESAPTHFVYEPNVYSYIVFQFEPELKAWEVEKPVEIRKREAGGVIESSLWMAMTGNGMDYELASRMEDALAWSVDFYHIQKDAAFKLIFEEKYVEGEFAGIGKLYAAWFKNGEDEHYAYYYENGKYQGFYDDQARPMKKAFLKAPVKYSRISSRFNPRRFHPILKRVKPHLGTDYAAPYGTPIYATADGTVIRAGYSKGNGRYVKIKHDETYQTQYLHMQGFAKGMRVGKAVKQGQVIGYVGSTGLATGPHVCYRFWKNGRQVDPLRQNLPPPEPMEESEVPNFMKVRDALRAKLDAVAMPQPKPAGTPAAEKGEEEISNP